MHSAVQIEHWLDYTCVNTRVPHLVVGMGLCDLCTHACKPHRLQTPEAALPQSALAGMGVDLDAW